MIRFILILVALMGDRSTITNKQAEALNFLSLPATHCMLEGGSGSGKTFIGMDATIIRALVAPGSRHAIFRFRFNHAKISVWKDTLPTVLAARFPMVPIEWNHSDSYIQFANGSQIWVGGLDEKQRVEKILGMTLATLYYNECSQISYDAIQYGWTRLRQLVNVESTGKPLRLKAYYDQNPPNKKHWAYKVFHEHYDPDDNVPLSDPDNFIAMSMHPRDNVDNLGDGYLKMLEGLPKRKRVRFWDGKYGDDIEGALWTSDMISSTRVPNRPMDMQKVCVGVDPAVTSKSTSDETGIITAGIRADHIYNWRDDTCRTTPAGWARAAVTAYHEEEADAIVCETNNGGDLVEQNIKFIDKNVRVVQVHATRGKYMRAEPISALMEEGRDHIVGQMPDLEDELTGWSPIEDTDSPNRLDAKVWACHWLVGTHRTAGTWGSRNRRQGKRSVMRAVGR